MNKFQSREELVYFLQNKATDMRIKIIKLSVIAGGGHIGGALSMIDILVALYYHILKIDPEHPKWEERDRFILSKGHGALAICPVLADVGFFPEEELANFNQFESPFGMHPDRLKVPGIEMSTGSLGHGFTVAVGMGLGARLDKAKWRVYCLLGDGECNEGSVWEASSTASHYKLGNLCAIVDRNKFSIDGPTEKIMHLEPFEERWRAFGWNTKIVDGHNFNELIDAFENLPSVDSEVPNVIIANTTKGKGVSFMESVAAWHYGGIDLEKERQAIADIEKMRPKR
ncbi:MAG: Transketolase 1 [Syntrophomonadaceae bacterium]|nr:Transketolase 1 [Bacillota bacterium]